MVNKNRRSGKKDRMRRAMIFMICMGLGTSGLPAYATEEEPAAVIEKAVSKDGAKTETDAGGETEAEIETGANAADDAEAEAGTGVDAGVTEAEDADGAEEEVDAGVTEAEDADGAEEEVDAGVTEAEDADGAEEEVDAGTAEAEEADTAEAEVDADAVEDPEIPRRISSEAAAGWTWQDGKWYYYSATGVPVTGWLELTKGWYYFDQDGVMVTGWKKIGGKYYYFADSGLMKTGWLQYGVGWYYLDENGRMATGWALIKGKYYYFQSNGLMKKGWLELAKGWYYLDENGRMVTGWRKNGSYYFYFDDNGLMYTGWLHWKGQRYRLDDEGRMYTGWKKLSNKWYFFREDGTRDMDILEQPLSATQEIDYYGGSHSMVKTKDGYAVTSIQETGSEGADAVSKVYVEEYSNSAEFMGARYIPMELESYRGFFAGKNYYFFLFSAGNPDEDDDKEVIRVVKYSRNWKRLGAAAIRGDDGFGCDIGYPFHYTDWDVIEKDGILYLTTGHRGYVDESVGQGHQGLLVIRVDEASMTGYVSDADLWHSFSQAMTISASGNMYLAEESEGSRCTTLSRINEDGYKDKELGVFKYGGTRTSSWAISTYASCEDVAAAGGNVFTVGGSIDQTRYDDSSYSKQYNIYLTITPEKNLTEEATTVKWLTSDNISSNYTGIRLAKITEDRMILIWTRSPYTETDSQDPDAMNALFFRYMFLNGKGEPVSKVFKVAGELSSIEPIVQGNMVILSNADGGGRTFYTINGTSGALTKKTVPYSEESVKWTYSNKTLLISGNGPFIGDSLSSDAKNAETLKINEGITSIPEFQGMVNLSKAIIPYTVTSVGDIFDGHNHEGYLEVYIPASVTSIGEGAFQTGWYWLSGNAVYSTKIYCEKNSYAQKFAEEKGITYELIDSDYRIAEWRAAAPAVGEWKKGVHYDGAGKISGDGKLTVKQDKVGKWIESTDGWIPKNEWVKVDGQWYYFNKRGYMMTNVWQDGRWIGSKGTWVNSVRGAWKWTSAGKRYEGSNGWFAKNQTLMIDGKAYQFDSKGICKNP